MPELSYIDYDGDGEKEITVIICSNVGTGLYLTDLHILKSRKDEWGDPIYEDHSLLSEDIAQWFTKEFMTKLSEDRKELIVNFEGKEYRIDTERFGTGPESMDGLKGVRCAESIRFYFTKSHEIKVVIAIGLDFDDWDVSQTIFGGVEAKVNLDGESLYLSDYKFYISPT